MNFICFKIAEKYCGWLRNPAPVDRWFIYPIIYRVEKPFVVLKKGNSELG
jgi:hypothetical protein